MAPYMENRMPTLLFCVILLSCLYFSEAVIVSGKADVSLRMEQYEDGLFGRSEAEWRKLGAEQGLNESEIDEQISILKNMETEGGDASGVANLFSFITFQSLDAPLPVVFILNLIAWSLMFVMGYIIFSFIMDIYDLTWIG